MTIHWWYLPIAVFAGAMLELIFVSIMERREAKGKIKIIDVKDEDPLMFLELDEDIDYLQKHDLVTLIVDYRSK